MRTAQTLQLTPQLVQSIKMLQLSHQELSAYIEAELEKNPFLERLDAEEPITPSSEQEAPEPPNGEWLHEDLARSTEKLEGELGTELSNVFSAPETPVVPHRGGDDAPPLHSSFSQDFAGGGDEDDINYERWLSADETLTEHLLHQLALLEADAQTKILAEFLIGQLDEAGYLRDSLAGFTDSLGVSSDELEKALGLVQQLEPAGVGARDLAECLKLQLIENNRFDPAMEALLNNLALVVERDRSKLKKICSVDDEDLSDMLHEIKALNPKPGLAFTYDRSNSLAPDVLVRKAPDGGWHVELNDEVLPRVLVNQTYAAHVGGGAQKPDDKSFMTDALQSANWLVKSLESRANTILKVASEIVLQQDAFLQYGMAGLKPLTLKQVAQNLGFHESTISRVTAHKTILTPRGLFEMRFFFTNAVGGEDGEDNHAAQTVRWRIKAMIDAEDPRKILSDDALVEMLKAEGIDIARRTVAKYREALGLGSSIERRRSKALR